MASFNEDLRAEILSGQKERATLIRQKLSFVIVSFGIGSLSAEEVATNNLLYLSPIIAFAFDLYIAGEDYRVKRAGAFLARSSNASEDERRWQGLVARRRDPFSRIANPFVSLVVLAGAAYLLWRGSGAGALYGIWLSLNVALVVGVWLSSYVRNCRAREVEGELDGSGSREGDAGALTPPAPS